MYLSTNRKYENCMKKEKVCTKMNKNKKVWPKIKYLTFYFSINFVGNQKAYMGIFIL